MLETRSHFLAFFSHQSPFKECHSKEIIIFFVMLNFIKLSFFLSDLINQILQSHKFRSYNRNIRGLPSMLLPSSYCSSFLYFSRVLVGFTKWWETLIYYWVLVGKWSKLELLETIWKYVDIQLYTLSQYPRWIHPGDFPGENLACKTVPRWKMFEFATSPMYII